MKSIISNCCDNTTVTTEVYCAQCKDWSTRSSRNLSASACCKITQAHLRRRYLRRFWSLYGNFQHTHRTARICPFSPVTTTSSLQHHMIKGLYDDRGHLAKERQASFASMTPKIYAKKKKTMIAWSAGRSSMSMENFCQIIKYG